MRPVPFVAVIFGAAGSIGFMLRAGHRNDATIPGLLLVLFTGWVLSPFVALLAADLLSKPWTPTARTRLHRSMIGISLLSLAIYGAIALGPAQPRPAAAFLIVPLASWLMIVIGVVTAMRSQGSTPR